MDFLTEDIAALRKRIKKNEAALADMAWARSFGGDSDRRVSPDTVELRLQAEITELEALVKRLQQQPAYAPLPPSRDKILTRLRGMAR